MMSGISVESRRAPLGLRGVAARGDPMVLNANLEPQVIGVSQRTFRKSKWRYLIRPALVPALFTLLFLFFAVVATIHLSTTPLVCTFWLLPGIGVLYMLDRVGEWSAWTLIARQGVPELLLREGLVRVKETRIPLTAFGTVSVEQGWLDRWLDVGTATINAIGGPFRLEDVEEFKDFCQVLNSRCAFIPSG